MKPLHLPLEGHDLLAVERFKDDTRHMAEFLILSTHCPLGRRGQYKRLFLTEDEAAELVESLDIYSLLQVVRHNATTVYSYITQGRQERSFNYRGEDLFRQKATLLYEETDQVTMEIVVATRTLELWLLEDMSLAVVSCVSVNYDHDGYITQYRTIKDTPVMDSELCLDLGELVEDLNGLCGPVYEHTQPVYEP